MYILTEVREYVDFSRKRCGSNALPHLRGTFRLVCYLFVTGRFIATPFQGAQHTLFSGDQLLETQGEGGNQALTMSYAKILWTHGLSCYLCPSDFDVQATSAIR